MEFLQKNLKERLYELKYNKMKKEEQDVDFEKRIRNLEKNVNKKEEKEKEI